MSQASIEQIFGKILLDTNFCDAFLADPNQILSDFTLTRKEIKDIKRVDVETLDHLSGFVRQHTHLCVRRSSARDKKPLRPKLQETEE